jgi:L-ascorbate 6-phosphate lactonase
MKTGAQLAAELEQTYIGSPTLWWLGHSGFAIKFANMLFLVDPCLGEVPGRSRIAPLPLEPGSITKADLVLCTHTHPAHMNGPTLTAILVASPHAKIVIPKSAATHARELGIPYDRMTTTDSDLRVEYFKDGLYGRVYAVPSAHDHLEWTPLGGYPYLGYLIRFGGQTIYHAGDGGLYEDLAERLIRYNVTVALLPVGGRGYDAAGAAELAAQIGARWLIPMHYGALEGTPENMDSFVEHLLGHRPDQRFKVFQCGEGWTVPAA